MNINLGTKRLITGFVARATRWVRHVEQELPTFYGVHDFIPGFCGVHVPRYLVFSAMFCRSFFVLLSFLFWPLYFQCTSYETNNYI